jgi:hypothetical protein
MILRYIFPLLVCLIRRGLRYERESYVQPFVCICVCARVCVCSCVCVCLWVGVSPFNVDRQKTQALYRGHCVAGGYDVSGCQCLNATANSGHIYRQYVENGKYLSVDGEGILSQTTEGGNAIANIFADNDFTHDVKDPTQVRYY